MEYLVDLRWTPDSQTGVATSGNRTGITVSPPAELGGSDAEWSPEHLLLSSLLSCLMLTALYFVKRLNIPLSDYRSSVKGVMQKSPAGLRFTSIHVDVLATVGTAADEPAMRRAMEQAKQFCPVSAALSVPVTTQVAVVAAA